MNPQINPQMTPRRGRRVGIGAMATLIQPGQAWSITVGNVGSVFSVNTIPQALVDGLALLGPVVGGQQVVNGVYSGGAPFTIPPAFSYSVWTANTGTTTVSYPVIAASVSGSPSCPSGMYWNGSACVAIPVCPPNAHWDGSVKRCIAGVVFTQATPSPPPFRAPPPHTITPNAGGTQSPAPSPPAASSTSSSSTKYYIAGAGVAALAAVAAYYEWGRKAVRR